MSLWDRDPQELLNRLDRAIMTLEAERRAPDRWEERNLTGALDAFARNELPLMQAHLDALPLPLGFLFNQTASTQPCTISQLRQTFETVKRSQPSAKL